MKKKKGFTLAEILITLTIIGVVAAITIPSLLANTNERVLDTKRKALHARMTQAIAQLNLPEYESVNEDGTDKGSALRFVSKGLNTVYKIAAVCDNTELKACDFPENITTSSGANININFASFAQLSPSMTAEYTGGLSTKPAAFRTQNGESVMVYYNPRCTNLGTAVWEDLRNKICVNMIYDLNGSSESPNKVGYDIGFITVIGSTNPSVVAPVPDSANLSQKYSFTTTTAMSYGNLFDYLLMAPAYAESTDTESDMSAAEACMARGSYILPSAEEAAAMVLNRQLLGNLNTSSGMSLSIWSSSVQEDSEGNMKHASISSYENNGFYRSFNTAPSELLSVRCIKK